MKSIKSLLSRIFILVLAAISLNSCEKNQAQDVDDLDLVFTNYAKDFNFKSNKTYALPGSVVLINGSNFEGKNNFAKPAYAETILASIRSNMKTLGWTEVAQSADPDVIVLPSVSQTTNIDYYYNYAYWDWYFLDGYYPGGWGWYYPGYYWPAVVTSYKTGSLLLQMTDPSDHANSDQLPVVWTCVVNGLLEGSTTSIQSRIQSNINQAFNQSSYLKL